MNAAMPQTPLCSLCVLMTLIVGCASWSEDRGRNASLPNIRENPRAMILQVEFLPIKIDEEDVDADASIWQWVDETAIDATSRRRLIANGLRIGRVINVERFRSRVEGMRPSEDVVDEFLAGASIASEVSHRDKRIPLRYGRRSELPLRLPMEGDRVTLLRLGDETIGRTLVDPQYLFAVVANRGKATGQASLRLRPEIQHGDMKQQWVTSDSALRIDTRRETWSLDELDVHLNGTEGDTFVVAGGHHPRGLAEQMLAGKSADNSPLQMLVMIRFDQVPGPTDEL